MNAGFVVVYASDHDGIIVDWFDIEPVPAQGYDADAQCKMDQLVALAVANFLLKISDYVSSTKHLVEMSDSKARSWLQSGLALTPFCGTATTGPLLGPCLESGRVIISFLCLHTCLGLGMDTPRC